MKKEDRNNMNRIGIFVFYDPEGVVDRYVPYLLDNIKGFLSELVVIVNGFVTESGKDVLNKYSDKLFERNNIGLDGGAYRDFFCEYSRNMDISRYDEIILFNDTYYGPLFPFSEMFEFMEKKKVDFWGISRHPGGYFGDLPFSEHIQAYFVAIRNKMFNSKEFVSFWNKFEYPRDHFEAVNNYEIKLTEYFSDLGYEFTTWLDQTGYEPSVYENVCCSDNMEDIIMYYHFPIIKKKIMDYSNFGQILRVYNYIDNSTEYPIEYIYENMARQYKLGNTGGYPDFFGLNEFYNSHKRVYIYGAGKYGHMVLKYFNYKCWKVSGIIETQKNSLKPGATEFKDIRFEKGDGVVLALGKKNLKEVMENIKGVVDCFCL